MIYSYYSYGVIRKNKWAIYLRKPQNESQMVLDSKGVQLETQHEMMRKDVGSLGLKDSPLLQDTPKTSRPKDKSERKKQEKEQKLEKGKT